MRRIDVVRRAGEALDAAHRARAAEGSEAVALCYRIHINVFYTYIGVAARDHGMTAADVLQEYKAYKESRRITAILLRPVGWLAAWAIYWGMRLGLWPAK